jgi:hypothetical protein
VITQVVGNGSQSCPDASLGRCVKDGIVVSGNHLAGAQFRLAGEGRSWVLQSRGVASTTEVALHLPADLVAGTMVLTAVNDSGSATAEVFILRGEPGAPGANGSGASSGSAGDLDGSAIIGLINGAGTSGRISLERLPSGDEFVSLINGAATRISHEVLPLPIYHLSRGGATEGTSARIDPDVLSAYCADADGCTVQIGMRYFDGAAGLRTGPLCPLQMDADGTWGVGFMCNQRLLATEASDWRVAMIGGDLAEFYPVRAYDSAGAGRDDDATACYGNPNGCRVLSLWDFCTISEFAMNHGVARADGTPGGVGLHFYMEDTDVARFSHTSRTCELVIRD